MIPDAEIRRFWVTHEDGTNPDLVVLVARLLQERALLMAEHRAVARAWANGKTLTLATWSTWQIAEAFK